MDRDRRQGGAVGRRARRGDAGAHSVVPFARFQRQTIDWLDLMHRQHTIHALLEIDVTDVRRRIRESRAKTGEPLSFTAFVVASLARAIAEDRRMHAYRTGRGRLVLFDDVDVTVLVERELEGDRVPVPVIVRAADKKRCRDITREIRAAQTGPAPQSGSIPWLPFWLAVPRVLRLAMWTWLLGNPRRRKRLTGTVAVTAVGMFGVGMAWAIPLTNYTLCLTVGSIGRKPGIVRGGARGEDERIVPREFLSLTLSVDHDVIDGAPAARFAARLKELVESGAVLADPAVAAPTGASLAGGAGGA